MYDEGQCKDSRFAIRDCGNFLRKLPRIEKSYGIFKVPVAFGEAIGCGGWGTRVSNL